MDFVWKLFGLCCLLLCFGCENTVPLPPQPVEEVIPPIDTLTAMEHIQGNGRLRAVTNRRHHNYHISDGRPAGFQFELLDDFCDLIDLQLDLLVNDNPEDCYKMLKEGEVDVFAGEIDSIADDSLFHHILLELPRPMDQTFTWVILNKEGDTTLLSAIQLWLDDFTDHDMRRSFYRYFNNGRDDDDTLYDASHICIYDDLIRAEAQRIGWDWRMLASIIFQESHFKPDLVSRKGAYGLMQLMPVVMEKYGIDRNSSVEEHLSVGGKLLMRFDKELPETITDSLERGNFILACYNAGLGSIMDAIEKAEAKGKDPNLWTDNVELFCPKQTFRFVNDITKRYSYYKSLIE